MGFEDGILMDRYALMKIAIYLQVSFGSFNASIVCDMVRVFLVEANMIKVS